MGKSDIKDLKTAMLKQLKALVLQIQHAKKPIFYIISMSVILSKKQWFSTFLTLKPPILNNNIKRTYGSYF